MQSVKETAQKAAEAVQGGAQRVAAALGGGNGRGNDEAESSPPPPGEPDLGQADWAKAPAGALEKMRESAAHAVEGVKMRLHLGSHGGEPTAEERTGESLHMAKAGEGCNQAQDDPIDHALHDALKPEPGRSLRRAPSRRRWAMRWRWRRCETCPGTRPQQAAGMRQAVPAPWSQPRPTPSAPAQPAPSCEESSTGTARYKL